MKVINKILQRAQRIQAACFGTPIAVTISTYKFNERSKTFIIDLSVDVATRYMFDSSMSDTELYEEWGRVKDAASRLLNLHVGHKVTRAGNLQEQNPRI